MKSPIQEAFPAAITISLTYSLEKQLLVKCLQWCGWIRGWSIAGDNIYGPFLLLSTNLMDSD